MFCLLCATAAERISPLRLRGAAATVLVGAFMLLWQAATCSGQVPASGQASSENFLCGQSDSSAKARILVGRFSISGTFAPDAPGVVEAVFVGTVLSALLAEK